MIRILSITINHEYHQGIDNSLKIIPIKLLDKYLKNDRIFLKNNKCNLDVYLEDDKSLLEELDELEFWVLCNESDFYRYTQLPEKTNDKQLFFWENSTADEQLKIDLFSAKSNQNIAFNTLGMIRIATSQLSDFKQYKINFKNKHTFWQYEITIKKSIDKWKFELIDEESVFTFNQTKVRDKVVFRSEHSIPYFKRAVDRLVLRWSKKTSLGQIQKFELFLPFPNFTSYILDNQKRISTVYINI